MSKYAAIPVDLFNKIVEYIGTRPYNEVVGVITEIRESAKVVDMEEEETVDE